MNARRDGAAFELARELLHARYRVDDVPDVAAWNDVLTTLVSHRSVRAYQSTPLPQGALELIVAAAQSASTSSNLQSWSVIAVKDPDRKARLSAVAANQAHIRECPVFLVWLADLARVDHLATTRGISLAALPFVETFLIAVIDAALAAQNAVVAAESLGLSTVYIGALRNDPARVAAELQLPARVMPVFGLCIGYADPARPADIKPRLGQGAVLHHERYSISAQQSGIGAFDAALRVFQQEQKMRPVGWVELVIGRLATIPAMMGRERLREVLRSLKFDLD
jgi:nitroreductase